MSAPRCRLFVIMASEVPVGLILRRGPTRWYHLLRWYMDKDEFEAGAWFRGRIYEEKCDLSPDGKLAVCFCHGGRYRTDYTDSWTVVSRAPWLCALALWPWGTTYGGGGRFTGSRALVLRSNVPVETHPAYPAHGLAIQYGQPELHRSSGEVDGADWSGRDHRGFVIFSKGGKLYRRKMGSDREIADFSELSPQPQPAPSWATVPLTAEDSWGT